MKSKLYLELLETFMVGLGFMFFSSGLEDLTVFPSAIVSMVRYFLTLSSLVFIVVRFRPLYFKLRRNIALLLLIFLVTMSFAWSSSGPDTLFAVRTQFLPMTAFGLYMAASFNTQELVRKLSFAAIFYILLSYALVFAVPSLGIDQVVFHGAWVGVQDHKNGASAYSLISGLVFMILAKRESRIKWFGFFKHRCFFILSILAFIFVIKSTSGTGITLSLITIAALTIYPRFQWKGRKTILLLDLVAMVVLLFGVIFIGNWNAILTGLGKDPTLTGRTVFWGISLQALFTENPFVGFGRGAFWSQPSSYIQAIDFYFQGAYDVPHAHNGYLEIALDTGIIGFCFFILNVFTTVRRALVQAYMAIDPINLFPLGYTIIFLVNNVTESLTSNLYTMFWPLYLAVSLNVGLRYDWVPPKKVERQKEDKTIYPNSRDFLKPLN